MNWWGLDFLEPQTQVLFAAILAFAVGFFFNDDLWIFLGLILGAGTALWFIVTPR